ncbi:hypothetical protein ACFW1M_26805 [Streptomyces inhibens]|uniref:hypothetical protein n=1 Tax=Streptomyces inhibens TaxID=2293571 RepID=UPI003688B831
MTTGEVIGFVLAMLASLLCLWGGVREARLQARLRRYGVHAEGVVVVDQYLAPSDDFDLTPVIEFTDRQGRPVRITPVATGKRMGMDLGGPCAGRLSARTPRECKGVHPEAPPTYGHQPAYRKRALPRRRGLGRAHPLSLFSLLVLTNGSTAGSRRR